MIATTKEAPRISLVRSSTLAGRVFDDLRERAAHPELRRLIPTGLSEWDRIAGGLGAWYVVIAGRQKAGKTHLMMHLRKQVALAGKSYVYLSLEMDDLMIGTRVFADLSGLELNKYRDLDFTAEDWGAVREARDSFATQKGYWNFSARTLEQIDLLVERVHPDFLFVDYLGLTKADTKHWAKRYDEIGEISRHFKGMCLPPNPGAADEDPRLTAIDDAHLALEALRAQLGDAAAEHLQAALAEQVQQAPEVARPGPETQGHRMGLVTAVQTSKEAQRAGRLDQTAPKDSNAPFEDCDLGVVINDALGYDGQPVPYMREISFEVSRVCNKDSFVVGINTALARIYDNPEEETVQTDINTYGF